jgi:hypothetical protein
VTLRVGSIKNTTTGGVSGSYVDLTVRRGLHNVEGYLFTGTSASNNPGIARDTAEAATAVTGGVRATATDASGNRYLLATPSAKTNDLAQGGFELTAGGSAIWFLISSEVNAAAPSITVADLILYYMGANEHTQRIVAQ